MDFRLNGKINIFSILCRKLSSVFNVAKFLKVFVVLKCKDITILVTKDIRSLLWSRGDIVTSHAAGPSSIPDRVIFVADF